MSQLDDVRDWVGDEPDDAAVNAALSRYADGDFVVERASLSILLRREANAGPAKWGVAGDYSEDASAGAKTLAERIARLRAIIGDEVSGLPTLTQTPIAGPPGR